MVAPRGIRPPSLSFRSAPAPRAPRGLPPLSALPLAPARCAQGLLLGMEMWRRVAPRNRLSVGGTAIDDLKLPGAGRILERTVAMFQFHDVRP